MSEKTETQRSGLAITHESLFTKKAPVNDFGRTVPSAEIYCCK